MSSEAADPRRWIALILLLRDAVHAHHRRLDRERRAADDRARPAISRIRACSGSRAHTRSRSAGSCCSAGACADLLGRRRLFMVGLALFTIASLACGFANTNNLLIAARAVQGLGGAMIAPGGALDPLDDVRRGRGAQQGARRLGRRLGRRRRRGRAARRRPHRVRRLGVGVLRQRADRPRRRSCWPRACCARAASRMRSARST